MNRLVISAALLTAFGLTQLAPAQEWGDLKMTFVLKGNPPKKQPVKGKERDPFCNALPIMADNFLVNVKNNAIQNVALFVDMKNSKVKTVHPDLKVAKPETFQLDNKDCVYVPHVLVVRPGQTIKATNNDKTGHNYNFNLINNQPLNVTIPIGGAKEVKIEVEEPAPMPVECNIHPWMKAHLIIQDHPYVGVSNADGVLTIEKLPVGKVAFRVWHENAVTALDEVSIGGKKDKWARGRFELDIKPGMNDFGKVEVDVKKFKD